MHRWSTISHVLNSALAQDLDVDRQRGWGNCPHWVVHLLWGMRRRGLVIALHRWGAEPTWFLRPHTLWGHDNGTAKCLDRRPSHQYPTPWRRARLQRAEETLRALELGWVRAADATHSAAQQPMQWKPAKSRPPLHAVPPVTSKPYWHSHPRKMDRNDATRSSATRKA